MTAKPENIQLTIPTNNLNLGDNVIGVEEEEYNNGRVSPVSDPRSPSPFQSFLSKAKQTLQSFRPSKRSSPVYSFEQVQTTPLYTFYESYLSEPSPNTLKNLQKEVKRLGINSPVVQTLRSYAEGVYENATYTKNAKIEKTLVNALGGNTLSSGGRQRRITHKKKRQSHKRKTYRRK